MSTKQQALYSSSNPIRMQYSILVISSPDDTIHLILVILSNSKKQKQKKAAPKPNILCSIDARVINVCFNLNAFGITNRITLMHTCIQATIFEYVCVYDMIWYGIICYSSNRCRVDNRLSSIFQATTNIYSHTSLWFIMIWIITKPLGNLFFSIHFIFWFNGIFGSDGGIHCSMSVYLAHKIPLRQFNAILFLFACICFSLLFWPFEVLKWYFTLPFILRRIYFLGTLIQIQLLWAHDFGLFLNIKTNRYVWIIK